MSASIRNAEARSASARALALAVSLAVAGCSAMRPAPQASAPLPAPVVPPAVETPVGTTASGGQIVSRSGPIGTGTPAVVDSQPSPEALSVLETIPDPLPPEARVTPPRNADPGPACWRIQLKAPADRATAEMVRDAAASQLMLSVSIEEEGGLFKVRTADCLDQAGADRLRERAIAAGFDGAFRLMGKRP